jgi:uroporphyrinogen-III synthase
MDLRVDFYVDHLSTLISDDPNNWKYSSIVLTSSTGVRALDEIIQTCNVIKKMESSAEKVSYFYKHYPIIVVGEGTKKTANKLGFSNVIVPPQELIKDVFDGEKQTEPNDCTVDCANISSQITKTSQPPQASQPPQSPQTSQSLPHDAQNLSNDTQNEHPPSPRATNTPTKLPTTKQGHITTFNAVQLGNFLSSLYPPNIPTTPSHSQSSSIQTNTGKCIDTSKPLLILSSKLRHGTLTNILINNQVPFFEHLTYDTIPNTSLWGKFSEHVIDSKAGCLSQPTFHVIFSPSGITSLMTHFEQIFNFLVTSISNSPQHSSNTTPSSHLSPSEHSSDPTNPNKFSSMLQLFTAPLTVFVAIGQTTYSKFEEANIKIMSWQDEISKLDFRNCDPILRSLAAQFLALSMMKSLLTCVSPCANGVREQVELYFEQTKKV